MLLPQGISRPLPLPLMPKFFPPLSLHHITPAFNSLIRTHTHNHQPHKAILTYTQMLKTNTPPNHFTFPSLLSSCAQTFSLYIGQSIHTHIIHLGFNSNVYTDTALLHMYSSCKSMASACKIFDEMTQKNSVSYNAMITGYTHNREFLNALKLFSEMQISGFKPTETTVTSVLSACAHLGALNQGKWVHEYIKTRNLTVNVFVGTSLIDMYAKCGSIDEAMVMFDGTRHRNVYTWNAIISGMAMNGYGEKALKLFREMVGDGHVRPDGVTFLGVLCACSHEGLVYQGYQYLAMMRDEFSVTPCIQHYGCMVDLLGRAGLLEETMSLIESMPIEPDAIVWRSLLGACRIHGRTDLSELAVQNLLRLEPGNGGNYVLLSNLYARAHRWNDVALVRETMKLRGIRKEPGCSSIEIQNVVYEFIVGKAVSKEICRMLSDVERELRLAGYVVDTEMVSYDVEEEEKETSLMYHSEKLALAFGLLKIQEGEVIRIVKNLRVCKDCHTYFKLVSKVYRRDITVRDRNRFHHFRGGDCSCGDYW
ncbi:hypothetical protein AMTRI_Chr09g37330 [Amborella trichopoda]